MNERHILVIGGGITGLSAAFALKQASVSGDLPVKCTVIEQDSRFGGKIQTHREGGFVMEGGPDSILARKPAGVQLIRELGIESEIIYQPTEFQKTYVLHHNRLHRLPPRTNMGIPVKLTPFLKSTIISPAGKARALLDLILPKRDVTGDETLGTLLRHRLGDEIVNTLIEPLLAGIYAGSIDELSTQATFPQFRKFEQQDGSLIRGSRAALGMQKNAQASASGRSAFLTLRGGLRTLIERLYDCLNDWASLHTDVKAVRIESNDDGTYRVTVNDQGRQEVLQVDGILVTTPGYAAAQLLTPLSAEASKLGDIPYVSTATVMMGYAGSDVGSLDGSGFLIPRSENRAITASTWVSSKWPHTTPSGYKMIRCYVGRAGQTEGLKLGDDEMVELVQRELREILSITSRPRFTRVVRWYESMPQYRVNHLQQLSEVEHSLASNHPHLQIAGAGYRGIGIPDCIAQGRQAADKLLDHFKQL